jgi:PAS domain S-box-containing protein
MTILLIDPESGDRERIRAALGPDLGAMLLESDGTGELQPLLARPDLRLVILEQALPTGDGLPLVGRLRSERPDVPVIMAAGRGDEDLAVAGMKAGLCDYVPKHHLERLLPAVREALASGPRAEELLRAQNQALAMIASGRPLREILSALVEAIERQAPGMLGSVLLLEGERLRLGAAPSLPETYNQAIEGVLIGPDVGSCGSAAYRGEPVVVEDIESDPRWRDYRALASAHGLRACWSVPIRARDGRVLGTFALYYRRPARPEARSWGLIEAFANLAAVAIEHRQGEAALRESEWRLRQLTENIDDVFWLLDAELRVLYVSSGEEGSRGRSLAQVLEDPSDQVAAAHPDDRAGLAAWVRSRLARDGNGGEVEYRTLRGGVIRRARARFFPIRDESGLLLRWAGVVEDVTERRQMQERIANQASLLDKVHDAIFVRDTDGRIVSWNAGARRQFGWRSEEVLGVGVTELMWKGATEQLEAITQELLRKGEWSGEARLRTESATSRLFDLSMTCLHDEGGAPRGVITIASDVTERKQLEGRFLRAQRLESIGTLAGGVAHDLNNVLTPVRLGADLLRRAQEETKRQALLDAITASVNRGVELLGPLLDFARAQEGDLQPLAVNAFLKTTSRLLEHALGPSIRLEVFAEDNLGAILGDAGQLTQALLNLAVNARDAMPQGGPLVVRGEEVTVDEAAARSYPEARPGRYVLLTVADTGCGISPETLDRIFDPFFSTKEVGKGAGLGLSTVRGVVRRHNGFLDVESQPGRGATFRLWLPASEREAAPAGPPPLGAGGGRVILLVDDEPGIRAAARVALEGNGYRVLLADNGAEAIAIWQARQAEVNAVVIDLAMPVMDGLTAIRALRRMGAAVPILPVSGLPPEPSVLRELSLPAFLPKPYTARQLLETLGGLLHAGASCSGAADGTHPGGR